MLPVQAEETFADDTTLFDRVTQPSTSQTEVNNISIT